MKDVNLTCPMILMNGVMIYDPVKKSCIHAEIIERDSVEYILKGRKKFGVTGFAYALSPEISEECSKSEEVSAIDKPADPGERWQPIMKKLRHSIWKSFIRNEEIYTISHLVKWKN